VLPDCLVADIFAELSAHLFNNYELITFNTKITAEQGSADGRDARILKRQ
jgi:hypothetical protein